MTAVAEPIMFPCSMPAPNNLRLGDVACHIDSGERGMVVSQPDTLFGDAQIRASSHSVMVTSNPERLWERVPYEQWTYEERVRSAYLRAPAPRHDDENDYRAGNELEWDLLFAMLDENEFEDLYPDSQWPDTPALARAVARKLDRLTTTAGPPT